MLAFIDASVILAALGSKSGGSSQVLKLIKKRKIDSHGHSPWSSLSSLRGHEAKASPTARSRGPRLLEIDGVTSQAVVEEVFRNAHKIKIAESEVSRLISISSLKVISAPASEEVEEYLDITAAKDAHVVASAIQSKAKVVITLDKKHLLSKKIKGLAVLTPGEFLQNL